jgi:hypothetical protein
MRETIIDLIIRATAQKYRTRIILDKAEARRLKCRVGDQVNEPLVPRMTANGAWVWV